MVKLNKIMKGLAIAGALCSASSAWALAGGSESAPAAPAAPGAAAAAPAGASGVAANLVAPQVQVASPFNVSGSQNAQPVLKNGMEAKLGEMAELNGDIQVLTLKAKKKELEDKMAAKPGQGGNGQGGPSGAQGGDSSIGGAQSIVQQMQQQKAQEEAARQKQLAEARAAAIARANMVEVSNIYGLQGRYLADMIVGGETRVTAAAGSILPNGQIVRGIDLNGVLVQLPGPAKGAPRLALLPVAGGAVMAASLQQSAQPQQRQASASPTTGPMDRFPPVITGPGVKTPILLPQGQNR